MVFVPFAWASPNNSGVQRVLDEGLMPGRMFCAMTHNGEDAGFAILLQINESISSYEDLEEPSEHQMWLGGSLVPLASGLNLEDGFFADEVRCFDNASFRFATQQY